jgi:adenine-specific DNA-methyltransferase
MTPLQLCSAIMSGEITDVSVHQFFSGLPAEEKHYWISSLYALLMPARRRQRLAAYFTPPHLARHVIHIMVSAGLRPGVDKIHDPASGGAAFLVPLASHIARTSKAAGKSPKQAIAAIEQTLSGVEIEPRLARLSEMLMADALRCELARGATATELSITRGNALKQPTPETLYDAVVANPPYGRIYRPAKWMLSEFTQVISEGYVNLYALFIDLAIRQVRPGGLICVVVPISFVGGSYFAALREHILKTTQVLRLDLIDKRSDVFLDVLYDVGVLLLRKKGTPQIVNPSRCSLLKINQKPVDLGVLDLPAKPSQRVWVLPDGEQDGQFFSDGFQTLNDYGYTTRTGYFVWNREQERYRIGKKPRRNEVPLYWAHNVRANKRCDPRHGRSPEQKVGFVKVNESSAAIVETDAIILQRTTNRRQNRRLIGALVRKSQVPGRRGFVSENHTVLVLPQKGRKQLIPISMLCRLLNTSAVDSRFRRISGTVSVSTKGLRILPLPSAALVRELFKDSADDERIAQLAYAKSAAAAKGRDP